MRMLLIASLAAISACSAAASPTMLADAPESALAVDASAVQVASADIDCEVRAVRTSRGVRLEAIAQTGAAASGEYEFIVTKRDRSGSSEIMQGGEYDLLAGDTQSLGSAEMSLERHGGYSARLILTDADGVACSAESGR